MILNKISFSTRILLLIVVTFYSTLISLSSDLNDFGYLINITWPIIVGITLMIFYSILYFIIKNNKVLNVIFIVFCLWVLYDGIILALDTEYEYFLFDLKILNLLY